MCGIAGILTGSNDLPAIDDAIERMTAALAHRGPDAAGVQRIALAGGATLALGHRRLSILDLSERARQPMQDEASGSWIAFNGEIYNHLELRKRLSNAAFDSTSDTETLLRGWTQVGPQWVDELRGIFAFALYDARRRQLSLVRDRLGVKPLYVCRPTSDTWLFASEVRAILASGLVERRLSQRGLDGYLRFGAVQAPDTLVSGVQSLLPAEIWQFDLSDAPVVREPVKSRYWSLAGRPRRTRLSAEDFQHLRGTWQQAVELELLSDVPVGVFLSGGIDSSAIVSNLAERGHRPQTFSVAFADAQCDESEHARAVAQACGSQHHELRLAATDVLDHWDTMIGAYDQPSVDGINTYLISQAVRAVGIKVALSGLGGDEAFAGYGLHRQFAWFDRLRRWQPGWTGALAAVGMRRFAGRVGRQGKIKQLITGRHTRLEIYAILREQLPPEWREALAPRGSQTGDCGLDPALAAELARQCDKLDAVNAGLWLDQSLYLQNTLLRDADQMSMAHALEVRVPFLDHLLLEELADLQGSLKLSRRGQPNKWLLVALAGDRLPERSVQRSKMGFVFPWERWLRTELRGAVENTLGDPVALAAAGLSPAAVAAVWQQYQAGQGGFRYSDILALVHLVAWIREHQLTLPSGRTAEFHVQPN